MQISYSPWPTSASLQFVVVMARYQNKWILSRHKQRQTWDIPGGKIDAGETPLAAAARELQEESGASNFTLEPIEVYHVESNGKRGSGLLCIAEVSELQPLSNNSEMAEIRLVSNCPAAAEFAHPLIQPYLFAQVSQRFALRQKLNGYRHLIWDWNGTIVNDAPLAVQIVNEMLTQQSLPNTDLTTYRQQFCHPVESYYAAVGFDFNRFSFEQICQYFGGRYHASRDELELHAGCHYLLSNRSTEQQQSILSAASQSSLDHCLKHHQIEHLFNNVFGLDNHHAVSKVERGKELLAASGICPSETLLIGDTDHDYEVSQALGIDCLLIAVGHQDYDSLLTLQPEVMPNWSSPIELKRH